MIRRVYYSTEEIDEAGREALVFEVEDSHYQTVVGNLVEKGVDLDDAFEKAVAMLSANARVPDEEITPEVLEAQAAATATVWFLLNEAADEGDRVEGDVLLVEKAGELYVTDAVVEDPEAADT